MHANELQPELLHFVEGAFARPLDAGDATFHGGYTLNYTGPNR